MFSWRQEDLSSEQVLDEQNEGSESYVVEVLEWRLDPR